MAAKFVDGPLDGREFDAAQLATIADIIPLPTDSGVRTFLAMPAPAVCDRILRGEEAGSPGGTAMYEQISHTGGHREFRYATDAEVSAVAEGRCAPGGEDARERRREFEKIADRLADRVKGAMIGEATDVYLIYRYADQDGCEHTARVSVTPRAWGWFRGGEAAARVYEASTDRDAIIGSIHALVRAAPTGWLRLRTEPNRKVRIAGFDLDIVSAG